MWLFRRKKRTKTRRTRARRSAVHYRTHKELARSLITARVESWSLVYACTYNRIAIKNQKRCWGSCSAKGNLNFNYRIIFLPEALMDYVIIHELCHLRELNHGSAFWEAVGRAAPAYREHRKHLRKMIQIPPEGFPDSVFTNMTTAQHDTQTS
jgi:predicted metal-dependent hydrolase